MFSIVCVYNDGEILRKYLKKSLNFQTVPYELILVDNTENEFASAAKALNHGASKATGEYLMFIHQDVDLKSETWIEDTLKKLKLMPDLGIAGVAGKSEDRKGIISNVKQGSPPKLAGINQITESTRVQTLDECLLIIPKIVYQELKFDEDTCTGWHLYGVDYCLSVKKKGLSGLRSTHRTIPFITGPIFLQ
ncbi:MAG: glycosyltransferase [Methanobacterium sp.]|nr:glycosyltransferase [Methanobacterium sp.]